MKSPQNMLFLLQTDCFHEITTFWIFQKNWKWYFPHFKKSTKKMATPVRSGYSDFGQNSKVLKSYYSLLPTVCLHERTPVWMFQNNWKNILNISKNQPKKSTKKMATPVRSRYSEFGQNWKVPKTCCFFFKLFDFSWKNNILNVSEELEEVFSTFQKTNPKK